MTNLKLSEIADICNARLGSNVFEVVGEELMNTTNRFEGNDVTLTIEDGEYIARTTGDTSHYGQNDGYVVANDLAEAYTIWTDNDTKSDLLDTIINTPWGQGRIYETFGIGCAKAVRIDINGTTHVMNMGEISEEDFVI